MLSSFTRNIALGSASTTSPSNSTFSSFGIPRDSISETGAAAGGRRGRCVAAGRRAVLAPVSVAVSVAVDGPARGRDPGLGRDTRRGAGRGRGRGGVGGRVHGRGRN